MFRCFSLPSDKRWPFGQLTLKVGGFGDERREGDLLCNLDGSLGEKKQNAGGLKSKRGLTVGKTFGCCLP